MPHFEVAFRLQHQCPFNQLSIKYPRVVLAWWTSFDQDVLEVAGWNPEDIEGYRRGLKGSIRDMGGHVSRSTNTPANWQLIVSWDGTKWEYSTSRTFVKNNCMLLQPTIYTGGWEWYRVIALSGDSLRKFFVDFDKKGKVEVISKRLVENGSLRDNVTISAASLFGSLTDKQAKALRAALDRGYYLMPKRISTETLAESAGVTRTTFGEHLRKAESKIMQSLTRYIELSNTDRKKSQPGNT